MSMKKWLATHTDSLAGKLIAISGATGGIGTVLCEHLATLGASLLLLDRNRQKSESLQQRLREKFPALQVSGITVDMEDMDGVKALAGELLALPLDALILNAGAYHIPRHTCSTGFDNVFQINFVSPYYLARKLMPKLRERGGRVVVVGSIAHNYSHIDESDVDFSTRQKASKVYGNAKRYLMYGLWDFAANDKTLAITHPGITFTGITSHYPKLIFAIIKHPMKVIFMKPKKACLSILYGLFENCEKNQWIGPRFFHVWGLPQKQRLHTCSESEAKTIAAIADKIYTDIERDD